MAEHADKTKAPGEETDAWTHPGQSSVTDDPWHEHAADEAPPQAAHGETSPGAIAVVGIGSFVVLVVLIGVVALFFDQRVENVTIERTERIDLGKSVLEMKAREQQQLRDYAWANAEERVVSIPIEKAIERVSEEYAQSP